ncbi:DUF4062 domain-containing protein [Serratia ureilytica]|uniref:DUF4062 domain-containing protein n=1 Tax=Serratia ureilytica TaxID=300181 RepID=UPI002FE6AEC9
MDDKKYQIFVSSTYKDLYKARKKVIEAILSIYHFPVGMEMFSADDSEQWEIIRETIDASDYYIVIIGHRYGVMTNDEYSYTEREYRYAKEIGIPVLAFIRSRNIALTDDERESNPEAQKKLNDFISLAQGSKMCDFWETPDDLVTKVAIALPKIFKRTPRVGWVRGSEAISKEISQELAELSNENRRLREKLLALEMDRNQDVPKLIVSLSDEDTLSLKISSDLEQIKMPERLSYSDITAEYVGSVSHADIDRYNEKLPSADEFERYKKAVIFYSRVNNDILEVTPKIKNIGRVSASNIRVEMVFPDFVKPMEFYDVKRIPEPKNIFPANPMVIKRSLTDIRNFLGKGTPLSYKPIDVNSGSQSIISAALNIPVASPNSWVDVNGSVVEVYRNKVMHTKSAECDSFILIPLDKGEGRIEVNIICEEYKEQATIYVPISVK